MHVDIAALASLVGLDSLLRLHQCNMSGNLQAKVQCITSRNQPLTWKRLVPTSAEAVLLGNVCALLLG
jgi:hypothetical protein